MLQYGNTYILIYTPQKSLLPPNSLISGGLGKKPLKIPQNRQNHPFLTIFTPKTAIYIPKFTPKYPHKHPQISQPKLGVYYIYYSFLGKMSKNWPKIDTYISQFLPEKCDKYAYTTLVVYIFIKRKSLKNPQIPKFDNQNWGYLWGIYGGCFGGIEVKIVQNNQCKVVPEG